MAGPDRALLRRFIPALFLTLAFSAAAGEIPAPKLELIRKAMASMKIEPRLQGLLDQKADQRVRRLRADNPALPDSLLPELRSAVAAVYRENLDGPGGLMPRIYGVLDRRLTEEDLKFVTNFRESDQGKRYRELVPRVVQESLDAARDWEERLEPEVRRTLEERLEGRGLRF